MLFQVGCVSLWSPIRDDTDLKCLASLDIYERWLSISSECRTKDQRPQCVLEGEQVFIQDILDHITLLFDDRRESDEKDIEVHLNLCRRALDMFATLGRERGAQLSRTTWDRFLRLMLGLADNLLHGSRSILAPGLSAQLYRVLIELFLRSLRVIKDSGDLWRLLSKFST